MKRDDAQEAVDFFKRAVMGEPDPVDFPVTGINYLPPVVFLADLPLRGHDR